jgi:hypothetical protein
MLYECFLDSSKAVVSPETPALLIRLALISGVVGALRMAYPTITMFFRSILKTSRVLMTNRPRMPIPQCITNTNVLQTTLAVVDGSVT